MSKQDKELKRKDDYSLTDLEDAAEVIDHSIPVGNPPHSVQLGGVDYVLKNKPDSVGNRKETAFTKLVDKQYSALVIRKFTKWGFPLYVGIITDNDLSDFDEVVVDFMEAHKDEFFQNNLQLIRNLSGMLSDHLCAGYGKTEGVAVTFYVDKAFVSSLFGDFMNHASCRIEYYGLLNMSTGV